MSSDQTPEELFGNSNAVSVFADVLGLLNQFECEPDEDSCAGAAFFTARLNEDSFYRLKGEIEKLIKNLRNGNK